MASYTNVQKVRILYKLILRLHRSLPDELQVIGTNYARDEFKRHKSCAPNEAAIFMNEWTIIFRIMQYLWLNNLVLRIIRL